MNFNAEQLRTIVAVIDGGSFERAASALGITASAVSQRIQALESSVGRPLVTRSRPSRATAAGTIVVRYARQLKTLMDEGSRELDDHAADTEVLVMTVHSGSLATWVPAALAASGVTGFDLIPDTADTADALREAVADLGITNASETIQGCRTESLGALRYVPAASPAFIERWFPRGMSRDSVAAAPYVMQSPLTPSSDRPRAARSTPIVRVPGPGEAAAAVSAGLGWSMLASPIVDGHTVIRIENGRYRDEPLYLRYWAAVAGRWSDAIDAIRSGAADALVQEQQR